MKQEYFYLVMSQRDMFENQVIEEVLRERTNYYISKRRQIDFWILTSPSFLYNNNVNIKIKNSNFYKQHTAEILDNLNSQYYALLISTNREFITWMKLRLGYFEDLENKGKNKYKSDGIHGNLRIDNNSYLLFSNKNYINPILFSRKFKRNIEIINAFLHI